MMQTVNERLRDESIAHAVWISRYSTGVAARMVKTLNDSDAELTARLLVALDSLDPSSFTVTFALPPSIEELAKIEHVLNIEELYPGTFRIRFDDDENITERVVALSIQNGWRLKEITMERCSLDIIFAQLSGRLKNNI